MDFFRLVEAEMVTRHGKKEGKKIFSKALEASVVQLLDDRKSSNKYFARNKQVSAEPILSVRQGLLASFRKCRRKIYDRYGGSEKGRPVFASALCSAKNIFLYHPNR